MSHMLRGTMLLAGLLTAAMLPGGSARPAAEVGPGEIPRLIRDLCGLDALAEFRAAEALASLGDAAVPELGRLASAPGSRSPRLTAVELLGRIGTPAAMDALIELLRQERKELAVRGQVCMQLGCAREKRAVPAIVEWLTTIGPKALNDIGGQPKEAQPSTCYLRHIEALGMIGDERAIPALEEFARKIPKGIGFGGFISSFVAGGVSEALADLNERQAFWAAVRRHSGLEQNIAPLFAHFRSDPLARFRLHEDEVIRRTPQGKAILQRLADGSDARLAKAAAELLARYDELARSISGKTALPSAAFENPEE